MKLSELMKDKTPQASFEGYVTNDDWVLAVDISGGENTPVSDYTVVQIGIVGLDAQLNPVTQDKQYIRAGQSSIKTGAQRTFKATGDRYVGDEFQDYAFSIDRLYGTGERVVTPYVYFNILNGKGEQGKVSIIVNSDASGSAGESSGIDIDLKKNGGQPTAFTYTAPAGE